MGPPSRPGAKALGPGPCKDVFFVHVYMCMYTYMYIMYIYEYIIHPGYFKINIVLKYHVVWRRRTLAR